MKKIVLICVSSQNVITFRKKLIEHLQKNDFKVTAIAFDDEYKEEIESLGVNFYCVNDNNRSKNPFKIFTLKNKYKKILKLEQPEYVFTFMLKPNTFGVKAAKKAGVKNIFSMVEGAGDAFANNTLKWKVVRFVICKLYKSAFKLVKKVFFLNNDDKKEFISRKLLEEEKIIMISGIGVDLDYFAFKPLKYDANFLMVARMLKTKGIYEYCECARQVKGKYPHANFNYLGAEGAVKLEDIKEYLDDGSVNYLGTTKDVRPFYEDCAVLVLPSYREGMPMAIMEAESIGRAIITTNAIGCKDTVIDNYNGFIIEKNNVQQLVEKCLFCLENNTVVQEMCENSRKFAEENFDSKKINNQISIEIVK